MNQTGIHIHIDAILAFLQCVPIVTVELIKLGMEAKVQFSGTLKAQGRQIGAGTIGEHQV